MSTVTLVPNKKASEASGKPVYYVPTGKAFRVQVKSIQEAEVRPGLFVSQNRTGFAYFTNEDMCKAFVDKALGSGNAVPGKVVYIDQTTPILAEVPAYGVQYPYPMNFAGKPTELGARRKVQEQAIAKGLTLQHADKDGVLATIYRNKLYTQIMDTADNILRVDNTDEVNTFVSTLLSSAVDPKAARLAELQAIPKTRRTAEQKAELADLLD